MVNVYAWNYHRIFLIMLFLLILWRILARYIRIDIWKSLNLFGAGVSFFLILKFTVLGRTPSGLYQFVVMAPYSDEFFRELLMNVFLYFPLGLTEYSCAMKSHFRKFGNQMSGSGNHLCNYASLLA